MNFLNFKKITCQIDVQFLLLFLQQQQEVSLFSPLKIELYLTIFIINARFEPPPPLLGAIATWAYYVSHCPTTWQGNTGRNWLDMIC